MIDKLERKFRGKGVPHLIIYVLAAYVLGFIIGSIPATSWMLDYLCLDPYMVCHGQIWRLVTWVISPPGSYSSFLGPIWMVIMVFMYYQLGTILEKQWGEFKFTFYIFSGIILTDIGVMAMYGLYSLYFGSIYGFANLAILSGYISAVGYAISSVVSTYYINMSIFLAFATFFPDMMIRLWFIIPVKMKYMTIVYGVIIAVDMGQTIINGVNAFNQTGDNVYIWICVSRVVVILMSLLNFFIFFLSTRRFRSAAQARRAREFQRAMEGVAKEQQMRRAATQRKIYKHKCAVCGRNNEDFPDLEFRFCSKCGGAYEYCNDHIFTHTHIGNN